MNEQVAGAWGGIISRDPLVTISKRADFFDQPMGFAPLIPDLGARGKSVHFIGLCNTLEHAEEADKVARDYEAASTRWGSALFVFIVSSELECLQLSRRGVPCFLANELMFVDDRRFSIVRQPGEPEYDAVYNAHFYPFKRHKLAKGIDKLLLLYKSEAAEALEIMRKRLPRATFANNLSGTYRRYNEQELSEWYGRSAVGLCLSQSEGAMRVSMEYQLCGIPVVSTPSRGGRDRYFIEDHVRVVKPEPDAISAAVAEMRAAAFDPEEIRRRAMRHLAFDRANFIRAANKTVAEHCGVTGTLNSFKPFRGIPLRAFALSHVLKHLDAPAA